MANTLDVLAGKALELCPTCGERADPNGRIRHRPTKKAPSLATLERWASDCVARATDGCRVEPDGTCDHGHRSWLLALGLI